MCDTPFMETHLYAKYKPDKKLWPGRLYEKNKRKYKPAGESQRGTSTCKKVLKGQLKVVSKKKTINIHKSTTQKAEDWRTQTPSITIE